jgi:hypothetical protein
MTEVVLRAVERGQGAVAAPQAAVE